MSATVAELFMSSANDHTSRPALHDYDGPGAWSTITWGEYRNAASEIGMALRTAGVMPGDRVAIQLGNVSEHVIADVGAVLVGACPVSVYNTFTVEQCSYVSGDSGAKIAIVGAEFEDKWAEIAERTEGLDRVIVIGKDGADGWDAFRETGKAALAEHRDAFDAGWKKITPDMLATIIYTSGTTGPPKGVQLTHSNIVGTMTLVDSVLPIETGMRAISYLPLAHIAERDFTHYRSMQCAGETWMVPSIDLMLEGMNAAKPHAFLGVPRVWEKMGARLQAAMDAETDAKKKKIAAAAFSVGRQVVAKTQAGDEPGLILKGKHAIADKLVFSKIRALLGLDECIYPVTGAAPINRELLEFFGAIGIEILEVYGMTETSGVISFNRPGRVKFGSVGEVVPGTEMKIADDGEVLSKGPHITPGYLNRAEATAETIVDGWMHTGDLGRIENGYLSIVGRKKELIITAGGKNLSPNAIEEEIKQRSVIVGQICALGDRQPFIGALVVLDSETTPAWAEAKGVTGKSMEELAKDETVLAEVKRAVDEGNANLARVEQVREYRVLGNEWTPETEELTPTMKLRRNVIHEKYADVISSIYGS